MTSEHFEKKYEKYEWSNSWWNNADDMSLPRILLIGDSISCAYGPIVIKMLDAEANVDRIANSRSITDPILFGEVSNGLKHGEYRIIHFNNGLHGWHITDDDYALQLKRYVELLQQQAPSAKLIWATSTPITIVDKPSLLDKKMNARVIARNVISREIMNKYDIRINDLYSLVYGKPDIRSADGYHYNVEGAELLGQQVTEALKQYL